MEKTLKAIIDECISDTYGICRMETKKEITISEGLDRISELRTRIVKEVIEFFKKGE